ncbi:MAG: PQQ-dependent sugar dehydrogenase [Chloroflexota bacterium]|nr:PQQ-dependent sugar dehydrogenase [Chloroflexota bacterium]MDE2945941.1 PQQ-dependent sugar dehydrogenase [Chloroflexota bacterium]
MKVFRFAILLILALSFIPVGAQDAEPDAVISRETGPDAAAFALTAVATGFERPIYATHAGDGSGRMFLLEQTGKVWIIDGGERSPVPFLDMSDLITPTANRPYSEQGLLGLAFHPDFDSNGLFFVSYTDHDGSSVIARYRVSEEEPDSADPDSGELVIYLAQPYANHNGGHIEFGPDGYLYFALGDGGAANDPLGAGQNRQLLLGSILRIDIDVELGYAIPPDNPFDGLTAARDEIWAYGLRNVWRFNFDRLTGDMYMADVGQNQWEEINFQPAESPGGENYGWNVWEGEHIFAGGSAPNHVPPIAEYSHALGCSVTGGVVYRGAAIPELEAVFLFGDYCSGRIWAAWRDPALNWRMDELMHTNMAISSFGEDEAGEAYVIDYGGTLYRFDPAVN